jgi:uncharacterized membrane protein YhaH (DUF805 family)
MGGIKMMDAIIILFVLSLWIVPIPLGIRRAKQKNRSPHWMWFGILPIYGWVVFLILSFIPAVKICPNCKEKNKIYAKTCQRCNSKFDESTVVEFKQKTKKQKLIKFGVIIGSIILIFFMFYLFINTIFKNSEIYIMTLATLSTNTYSQEIIGNNIESRGFVSGNLSTSGSTGTAGLSFSVSGTNGKFKVYVIGIKEFDKWKITKLYIKDKELVKIIDE